MIAKYLTYIAFCILILGLTAPHSLASNSKANLFSAKNSPSPAEIKDATQLAAKYLERACDVNGKFIYEIDTASGQESSSYDIIRHNGAMYALAMYNHANHDPKAIAALVRAAHFLRRNYISKGMHADQLVVWSRPVNSGVQPKDQFAELGGTALGLIALTEVREIKPEVVPLGVLEALGRFLLFLERNDGSFVNTYRLQSGPVTNWHSLYYPGEAALALVYLYEADHSSEWLLAAGKALSFLARSRVGLQRVPADHWALIASAKIFPYCESGACGISKSELVVHAVQVCKSILREQLSGTKLDGAFDPVGRIAPTATRLEGLLAALQFLPNPALRQEIALACNRGVTFLLRAQIKSGPYAGGLPGALLPNGRNASEIRIDYLQHAMSAWVRYLAYAYQ